MELREILTLVMIDSFLSINVYQGEYFALTITLIVAVFLKKVKGASGRG